MSCLSSCFRKKEPSAPPAEQARVREPDEEEVLTIQNTKLYRFEELRVATQNFSLANKIGRGGFGSVYKGRLRDGTMAAIKVLSADSMQGKQQFMMEINTIAKIEHDNLVKLHGCCVEGNHRILVYGYLENNSLAQTFLRGNQQSRVQFSWSTRCKICIGIAQGLRFLHEEVKPCIVHRDIKASNILLDKGLIPKISDFGLAKLFPSHLTHISTKLAGTTGYLAPEYVLRGQLSRKADVYSFGIVLLEIVSGTSNRDKQLPLEEQCLLERAWISYNKGELESLVDCSLNGACDIKQACRYLKVGLLCAQEMPKLRPSMSVVLEMLTGEIDVNEINISKPGFIADFRNRKNLKPDKDGSTSEELEKLDIPSSSSGIDTSHATMTFTSILYRST